MIFARLAKFVVKRYIIVILAWLVVMFYAFPLIFGVNNIIAYQETEFVDQSYESQQASAVISDQFPHETANSSMIVVILDNNLTVPDKRDLVLQLESDIKTASGLRYLESTTSIYDVYEQALAAVIAPSAANMSIAESEVNLTLRMLFGIPEGYFTAFQGVNSTASMVFGIPLYYLGVWNSTSGNDAIAYSLTKINVTELIAGMDQATRGITLGYYAAFSAAWNSTSAILDSHQRLNTSISMTVQGIVLNTSTPVQYADILMAVDGNLTTLNFANPNNQSDISLKIMSANIGSYLTDPMSASFASGLLQITHNVWNGSFTVSPSELLPSRISASLQAIQADFLISISSGLSADELALFSGLTASAGNFGPGNYSNAAIQHSFVLGVFSNQTEITNMTFLQEVYDLGSNASKVNVTSLAWKVVREGTIGSYPVELPAGIKRSFISGDNNTMLLLVSFTKGSNYREADGNEPILANVKIVRDLARDTEISNAGLKIYTTGDAPISSDFSGVADRDLQLIEPITIILVLVLMGAFFRSVLGPVIPLASIGVALGLSQSAVFIIGTYVAQVHFTVLTMLIAILFGVGTDYSIFILARYREELLKGAERKDAMQTSITWAGESIATSGATVIISFAAVSTSSFGMLKSMGLVLSVAVLIALLVALTLVPSIALALKGRIFWPISGRRWTEFRMNYLRKRAQRRGGYFRKAAKFATKHAVPIFILAVMISIPTSYLYFTGATSFDFINGMGKTESVDGINAISHSFGAGRISPTEVVIQFQQPVIDGHGTFSNSMLNTIENVSLSILSINSNVREIDGPTRPNGDYVNYSDLSALPPANRITLEMQMKSFVGRDNRTVMIDVIYTEEPLTVLSMDTTRAIRTQLARTQSDPNFIGARVLVGGESASLVDVDEVTSREFRNMEILVMIGVFIVLLVVLGSIILPLFAILSIGLSISWTLAATILIFGSYLNKPVLWILPIIIFVILMGLGMDYNIFILTRIREEAKKNKNHEKAIIEAVDRTGGIITACAVIMAGAFGSLMISNTTLLQEFGFALSFAVLLDAMLVRTYVTPAIMKIIGPKWTWWGPKRLQRIDPKEVSSDHFEDREL